MSEQLQFVLKISEYQLITYLQLFLLFSNSSITDSPLDKWL